MNDLDWVKAHHDSPYGRISIDWERKENKILFRLIVPVGSTATVYIPGKNITEGDLPVSEAEGVNLLQYDNGTGIFMIESGNYNFSINI